MTIPAVPLAVWIGVGLAAWVGLAGVLGGLIGTLMRGAECCTACDDGDELYVDDILECKPWPAADDTRPINLPQFRGWQP